MPSPKRSLRRRKSPCRKLSKEFCKSPCRMSSRTGNCVAARSTKGWNIQAGASPVRRNSRGRKPSPCRQLSNQYCTKPCKISDRTNKCIGGGSTRNWVIEPNHYPRKVASPVRGMSPPAYRGLYNTINSLDLMLPKRNLLHVTSPVAVKKADDADRKVRFAIDEQEAKVAEQVKELAEQIFRESKSVLWDDE